MDHHVELKQTILRNSNTVYRLAYAQMKNTSDADDVYQEVLYRYIRKKPFFENQEHEKAWFLRVATNKCHDLRRTPFWRRRADWNGVDLTEETPEELGVLEELMRLPGKYREVIRLHYIEGYRIAEIAEMLGRKESTVKVQLHRGRELLRLNLEERGIQP